jgi:Tfp pilus assembly protein PilO
MNRLRSPKAFAAIGLVLVVLLLFAGYFLLVSPERSKASRLREQVATAQARYQTLQFEIRSGRDRHLVQVADVFRLAKAMPAAVDMPDILLQLNSVASAAGVDFQSITPGAAVAGAGYETIPIALVFQGNYRTLSEFLQRLRHLIRVSRGNLYPSGRLFNVNSIAFAQGTDKFPQLQATLNIETYVYTGQAAPTPPTSSDTSSSDTSGSDATAAGSGATG